jgi:glycosyltransferase involved in cell wall biosynthesis
MKILHIYRDLLATGGVPHQSRRLVESQSKLGHEVTTVSLKGNRRDFKNSNAPVETIEIRAGFGGLRDLRCVLRTRKPDIVHFTGLWIPLHQLWGMEVLKMRVPFVISPYGSLSPYRIARRFGEKKTYFYHRWAKKLWRHFLEIPLLKHAIAVHAHSRHEAELIEAFGITKIFIAPCGIDAEWVNSRNGEERKLHGPITFLHLGRLDIHHKGLDLVIEALRLLLKAGVRQKCRVIFVGPTVNKSGQLLQQQADELGNEILEIRQAVWSGWGQDHSSIWPEADYFLGLHRCGGMALAPCQAVGQKIPLIASREGDIGDWTASANMGFVVPLQSRNLCEVFERILQISKSEYRKLSENAWKFALTYNWENVANRVVEGYQDALSTKHDPVCSALQTDKKLNESN